MKKKYFTEAQPFINRKKEQEMLMEYFQANPKNIMFLYGPKSTGKTTLIRKVLADLDDSYDISSFNMREHLIVNFKNFVDTFFPPSLKDTTKNAALELLSASKLSLPGFSWEGGELETLKKDVFKSLLRKIEKLKTEGKKVIIILDEFQYLRNIKIPDDNQLLVEELFKFFIALTKQNNLAHVVCLTSDSYYLEELYSDTKLSNTSRFELIDHLSREDVYTWLREKEECPKEMIDDIWENLGGSVWEIWQVFVKYKNTGDWKEDLADLLQIKYSYLAEYYSETIPLEWREEFLRLTIHMAKHGKYEISNIERIMYLVEPLVEKDLWFFDTKTRTITPNSKSIQKGMQRLVIEIDRLT